MTSTGMRGGTGQRVKVNGSLAGIRIVDNRERSRARCFRPCWRRRASRTASAQPSVGKLNETWTAVSAARNGQPADEIKEHRLTFAGDTFVIERDGKTLYTGTFKTDREETRERRLHPDRGPGQGKTWRGIYLLEGDTLRTNDNAPDVSKPRPTRFTTTPDSGHVLVVFKRS